MRAFNLHKGVKLSRVWDPAS